MSNMTMSNMSVSGMSVSNITERNMSAVSGMTVNVASAAFANIAPSRKSGTQKKLKKNGPFLFNFLFWGLVGRINDLFDGLGTRWTDDRLSALRSSSAESLVH
ncbi:hypothetical protein ACX93W_13610 [Paenibacillus sp. CAU 1782]